MQDVFTKAASPQRLPNALCLWTSPWIVLKTLDRLVSGLESWLHWEASGRETNSAFCVKQWGKPCNVKALNRLLEIKLCAGVGPALPDRTVISAMFEPAFLFGVRCEVWLKWVGLTPKHSLLCWSAMNVSLKLAWECFGLYNSSDARC